MSKGNLLAAVVAGALNDDVEREAIIKRCVAEMAGAGRLLSVPGLCNRLWLEAGPDGYEGAAAAVLIGEVPAVSQRDPDNKLLDRPQPAVALGAIVEIALGYGTGYAEVAWKEGAHPALHAG
jgi:hypothetical protein